MGLPSRQTHVPTRWRPAAGPLLWALSLAALDQAVKVAVVVVRPEFQVLPGFFAVRLGTNTGMAFGLFQGFPLAVSLVGGAILIALLVYLGRVAPVATMVERAALSLLIGGAIGNLVDRLRLGYVVDYLDLYVGQYHWPTFNLADSAVTIGASLLALGMIRGQRAQAPRRAGSEDRG